MKTKPKYKTIQLSPAQEKSMRAALKSVLKGLGWQPHLGTFSAASKDDRLVIEFQPLRDRFTYGEVISAIQYGKYPRGMTAKDLAAVPAYTTKRKIETALHFALSRGQLPPKTTLTDLFECCGRNKRRAIFAMFDDFNIIPRYPPELTAQHLAKFGSNDMGSLLHRAATQGAYPNNCTVRDLMLPLNKRGQTPLHTAAIFGHLLSCTKADLQGVKDNNGRTAWDCAVKNLSYAPPHESSVRNLLACPELCQKLRLNRKAHGEILELLLASPELTPELRNRMAVYPHICAAML